MVAGFDALEQEPLRPVEEEDDRPRTGTVWTATAHIVTAVIGSGVLALAWSVAQLGWIAGLLALIGFSCVTCYTSTLLANAYRSPDPVTGPRNRTYTDAVRSYLGPRQVFMCGAVQYMNMWGTLVGFTITATTSMIAIMRSECRSRTALTAIFGMVQLALSQFPSLENIAWLSVVAAATSFAYSSIGLGLCIAKWTSNGSFRGHVAGVAGHTSAWSSLQALGNIAFASTFAEVLIEIQDTLRSPPAENITMKKAARYAIGTTSAFYLALGYFGYAAFGADAPGNILTGFHEPFWLVDLGNVCIIIHLAGAYQVYAQPIFAAMEGRIRSQWPEAKFTNRVFSIRLSCTMNGQQLRFTLLSLVLRTAFIAVTTVVAMLLPFFNGVLGVVGAMSFWPLTVYFPVSMHMVQGDVRRGTTKWAMLQGLSALCLMVSLAASVGSVADIVNCLRLSTSPKLVG